MQSFKEVKSTTIKAAIKSDSPAIALIAADSVINARALLTLLISGAVKSLNVGKTMVDFQIAQCVDLILEDERMKSLKPDDFKLCFNNALKGHYGKVFDRIDSLIIFEWLNTYIEERTAIIEQEHDQFHTLTKNEKINPLDINIEGQKKVVEILKAAVQQEEVQSTIKDRPRNTFTHHQELLNEFEALYYKTGFENAGGRFVKVEGKNLNQIEFVEYKIKQLLQNE